jgi:hypothetical protein
VALSYTTPRDTIENTFETAIPSALPVLGRGVYLAVAARSSVWFCRPTIGTGAAPRYLGPSVGATKVFRAPRVFHNCPSRTEPLTANLGQDLAQAVLLAVSNEPLGPRQHYIGVVRPIRGPA